MDTRTVIDTHVEEMYDYDWLTFPIDAGGDIEFVTDSNIKEAAEALKASPELVDAVNTAFKYFAETLIEKVSQDLKELWELVTDE